MSRGGITKYLWIPCMLLSVLVLVLQVGILGYMYVYDKTPLPKLPPPPQTTHLYDRDGRLLTSLHAEINRTDIDLGEIPLSVRHAAVATEDKDFYREGAVSIPSIMRAAWSNFLSGRFEQGGSTITQQYVKNAYTGSERTLSRKLREAVLAQKLDRIYSKNQILEKYLNTVYFGEGAYGIQAAAQTYFGVKAAELSYLQAATLVGIIAAPSRFDPIDNPGPSRRRRDFVLDRMATQGYLSDAAVRTLQKYPLGIKARAPTTAEAPYFTDYAKRYLEEQYGTRTTFGGGLQVTTTIDLDWQQAAEAAVRSNLSAPGDPAGALVAIDPETGGVRALVGGKNFDKSKFNLATQGHRQTGSAFKTFTLATAIKQGIPLSSVWYGPSSIVIPDPRCYTANGPWNPHNYADASGGTMTLLEATAQSVNTIFAQLVVRVGPDKVADMARRMGVESPLESVCSITLGSQAVSPLDMTSGYATLAARGLHHDAVPVESITSPEGDELFDVSAKGERALPKKVADLTTYALQSVIDHGTGTAANIGRPAAGKTGTAQNYVDAWFCGYVPQLAACVWVGYPKGEIPLLNVQGVPQVFGGSIPADIWRDFMVSVLADQPALRFADPFAPAAETEPEPIREPGGRLLEPPPAPPVAPPPSTPFPAPEEQSPTGAGPRPPARPARPTARPARSVAPRPTGTLLFR